MRVIVDTVIVVVVVVASGGGGMSVCVNPGDELRVVVWGENVVDGDDVCFPGVRS